MIKWQIVIDLPDNLTLKQALDYKHGIQANCPYISCTLKIERITEDKPKNPEGKQIWLPFK